VTEISKKAETHFLLSGGNTSPYEMFEMYRYMAELVPKNEVTFITLPFANTELESITPERTHWFEGDAKGFAHWLAFINPHKRFTYIVPSLDPETFCQQLQQADVIWAHGGNGDVLQANILKLVGSSERLKELVTGKVCGGNSAGCNMWTNSYYSNDNAKVCLGLDIVKIKTFCHYQSYKWDKLNEIVKFNPKLPFIPLHDNEFVKISIMV